MSSKKIYSFLIVCNIFFLVYISGCGSASESSEDESENKTSSDVKNNSGISDIAESEGELILNTAKSEQGNEMYSPDADSTYLYWLNNEIIFLNGSTKCNIFALNVLYRSGFRTPPKNALARDLYDTSRFTDILPVVGINDISNAKKGDLIAWYSHVIVFESTVKSGNEFYALAWWAGTGQEDNGDNIKNNVCHGKYRLSGEYVVRRPVKK